VGKTGLIDWHSGDHVRILRGAYSGWEGRVVSVAYEAGQLVLALEVFGEPVILHINTNSVIHILRDE